MAASNPNSTVFVEDRPHCPRQFTSSSNQQLAARSGSQKLSPLIWSLGFTIQSQFICPPLYSTTSSDNYITGRHFLAPCQLFTTNCAHARHWHIINYLSAALSAHLAPLERPNDELQAHNRRTGTTNGAQETNGVPVGVTNKVSKGPAGYTPIGGPPGTHHSHGTELSSATSAEPSQTSLDDQGKNQ